MIDLEKIKKEYQDLGDELTNPDLISDWERFQELSKKRAQLEKIVKKAEELKEIRERIEENSQIIASQEDAELASLAEEELKNMAEQQESLQKELEDFMKNPSTNRPTAVIMEIRAGTGGQEAALFARSLFDMYSKFAASQNWKQTILDMHETELNGMKEVSFILDGEDVYEKLRYEGGVHRVQRIPATEKSGRIHTSTASVAVLPKANKAQIQINPADLKIETFNASGPGGQNVNKRQTAVRIIYTPTGLVVNSQSSRSQQQNKENAMALLESKLLEEKQEAEGQKTAGARKAQIGSAKRVEKIRTYNFPQDRITDHRTKQNWHGIEKILEGDLDTLVSDVTNSLQES